MRRIQNSFHHVYSMVLGILNRSADYERPKERQTRRVFCYVAKASDTIILERGMAVLLRLTLGALCALVTSIVLVLALTTQRVPKMLLLILPWLQLLTTAAIDRWVRVHVPPHLWVNRHAVASPSQTECPESSTTYSTALALLEGHHHPPCPLTSHTADRDL